MEWVNYHHLLYFRTVAREGSITRASKVLNLAQPTISGQIRALEETLGEKLFGRQGRNLVMTEFGKVVYRYADEIFTLGKEMTDVVSGRPANRPSRLSVGVSDLLPKLLVRRLLAPALSLPEPLQIVCHEERPEQLINALQMHGLDLLLTDAPMNSAGRSHFYNHLLGSSGMSVFGTPELAGDLRRKFPQSLDEVPFLLPLENSVLRRHLDHWFAATGVRPKVAGEFQDSSLMLDFGQSGSGLFVAPTVVEDDVARNHGLAIAGRIPEIEERYYAVAVERRLTHPGVTAILESARQTLVASTTDRDEAA